MEIAEKEKNLKKRKNTYNQYYEKSSSFNCGRCGNFSLRGVFDAEIVRTNTLSETRVFLYP